MNTIESTKEMNASLHSSLEQGKKGLYRLGYVKDIRSNLMTLQKMIGHDITTNEITTYIESNDFKIEYLDMKNEPTMDADTALVKRFVLPNKDKYDGDIYGEFYRKDIKSNFVGVYWRSTSIYSLLKYGKINPNSIKEIASVSQNEHITNSNIFKFVLGGVEYFNGAGYKQFPNGATVSSDTGKFARFQTILKNQLGNTIFIWFTKNAKGDYEGLNCGDENDFKESLSDRQSFFVGRMSFDSIEKCNSFLKGLAEDAMDEPWEYKNRIDKNFDCPILKSYLEHELNRLFHESEELHKADKIIFNRDNTKILFNTNLLDKFAHDLIIVGDVAVIGGKKYVTNLQKSPSKQYLRQSGFTNISPLSPEFFSDINEIVFHCDWDIDNNMAKYTHIIEQRIERFPEKYKGLDSSALSNKLDNAIQFAKNIAQRNYKFIVPMYYPSSNRIQLLMPIYLENSSIFQPDFALVLTPHPNEKLYTPETILGLEEVYQDARLIAKPDESWLNPQMIK